MFKLQGVKAECNVSLLNCSSSEPLGRIYKHLDLDPDVFFRTFRKRKEIFYNNLYRLRLYFNLRLSCVYGITFC